jgi:hypothetical protein
VRVSPVRAVAGVRGPAPTRLLTWVDERLPAAPLHTFRQVFGAIWLVYDLLDIALKGTAWGRDWLGPVPADLVVLQVVCIGCELAMVTQRHARLACGVAAAARFIIAFRFFRLNDFFFLGVACLLLAFLPDRPRQSGATPIAPRWLVDVLRWQTAYVYLATSLLKVNEVFLGGGHLYVRHAYLAEVWNWPYPGLVRDVLENKRFDAAMGWTTVLAEGALAALLFLPRPRIRRHAVWLAVFVHGFAALFVNVWFFGATMIALVWCVSRPPVRTPGSASTPAGS